MDLSNDRVADIEAQDNRRILLRDLQNLNSVVKDIKSERVMEISVRGKGLKNMDGFRDKSDTQVSLFMKWKANQLEWHKVDSSEVIFDNLDPVFTHNFNVIHNLGQIVQLKFSVDDIDHKDKTLIGEVVVSLTNLITR